MQKNNFELFKKLHQNKYPREQKILINCLQLKHEKRNIFLKYILDHKIYCKKDLTSKSHFYIKILKKIDT